MRIPKLVKPAILAESKCFSHRATWLDFNPKTSTNPMKPRFHKSFLATITLIGFAVTAPSALAVDYYWDNNGTDAGFGTAGGTWADPTTGLWSLDSTGVAAPGASITTTTGDILYFGTDTDGLASGTITVSRSSRRCTT